jgi:Zn-dependent protease/CBS domain-containing protein
MRFRQFQLARISGIPLIIDLSWLPVVALHLWLASAFYLPQRAGEGHPAWQYWVFGGLMTALLFGSILAHELAHAIMARLEGIKIHDIQLHIFGGWTRLGSEPDTPLSELRVAVAGPAASFLIGIFFMLCLLLVQWIAPAYPMRLPLRETFRYLFLGNFVLAMFNLMPGLPLDGGRALRAWLWHRRGDALSATLTAKRMGVGIAYMLTSFGLFSAFYWGDFLTAVWMVVVGFFLKNVAENDYRHRARLHAHEQAAATERAAWQVSGTVGSIMSTPAVSVAPEWRISEFIGRTLAHHRHTSFPVARDGRLHGILSLRRLKEVPEEDWERLTVGEVMTPIDESLFVTVRASLDHAAHKLRANDLGRLAVVDQHGLLIGYLSEVDLERASVRA